MEQLSGIGPSDWVTMHARRDPDGQCFVDASGHRATFGDVAARVGRLAGALDAAGFGKGDRIAVLATDSVEYLELFLASMRLGTIIVPLNYRLAVDEMAHLLSVVEPAAFFASERYADAMAVAKDAFAKTLRLVGGVDGQVPGGETTISELIGGCPGEGIVEGRAADEDILSLPLTSGTTGTPKGVMQSQRMIKAVTTQGVIELRMQRSDFCYSGAPMFHISGVGHIFYGLARGGSSLVLPQFDTDTVLRWMQTGGLTHCLLIPSMVISLLRHPEARARSYGHLRSIMYGGAPTPPAVIREMIEVFGCGLYNGFGAGTEAGGQTIFTPEDHVRALSTDESLLGSIGKPMYGIDLKLCDLAGHEVPRGAIGEIHTRSDTVMSGYLNQPELTAESFRDGWFHVGDMARLDEDGYLHLEGRRDDMIIRGGENVYPVEIEDTLAEHAAIREVAVIGLPDAYWGEIVAAVVTTEPGAAVTLEEIQAHCRERIASYKVPARLEVLAELPRNPTGKVLKTELRRVLTAG